jgi:hypothetical protein
MGDIGLMETGEPLSSLVARAKHLLDDRWTWQSSIYMQLSL